MMYEDANSEGRAAIDAASRISSLGFILQSIDMGSIERGGSGAIGELLGSIQIIGKLIHDDADELSCYLTDLELPSKQSA